jgi:hypothetical protein
VSRIVLGHGPEPLPFFAEYPYYLWGEVNYDSEGDCKRPTDRAWTRLELANRATRVRLAIKCAPSGELTLITLTPGAMPLANFVATSVALDDGGGIGSDWRRCR